MKRNLLAIFVVCWVAACYGQFNPVFTDSNPFETMNDIHGPVKQITMPIYCKGGELRNGNDPIHNPKDVHIYDRQGRETDWFTAFGQHYVTTYTTHASRTYCYAEDGRLFEYNMLRRYNESGKETLSLYMRGDSVLRMDSMIYNQWGKVAVRYHTEADGEFHVACSYKYDASGNVLGMKNITSEKKILGDIR